MSMTSQKKIAIALIVVVILFGAGFFYYLFSSASRGPTRTPFFSSLPFIGKTALPGTGALETPASAPSDQNTLRGRLRQIVDKEIFAPALSADGKSVLYALRENGHIESRDLDGENPESLSNVTVPNIYDASWHPKRDRITLFYADAGGTKAFIAGIASGTPSRFLPREAASADWAPDGSSLAYFLSKPSGSQLVLADPAVKSPRSIYETPVPDFTVRWLSKRALLLTSKPSGLAPSIIMKIDPSSRNASLLFSGANGATILPSPRGTFFLLGYTDSKGEMLGLKTMNAQNGETLDLVVKTFPEKCVIAKDEALLYCAIPDASPPKPEPDLWYRGDVSFSDTIAKIHLPDGRTEEVGRLPGLDAISLFLSSDGGYLFFADKKTDTLWRLELQNSNP